jgi:hypothetical protein
MSAKGQKRTSPVRPKLNQDFLKEKTGAAQSLYCAQGASYSGPWTQVAARQGSYHAKNSLEVDRRLDMRDGHVACVVTGLRAG